MSEYPMISCIMPTRNRRRFVEQAIALYQAQDYPHRELIIVDDSDIPSSEIEDCFPGVRYTWLSTPLTIGMKRNIACSLAKGELLCHWDDDDYYGPARLSRQAAPILAHDTSITGMVMSLLLRTDDLTLWRMPAALRWVYFAYGVRAGTLMYRRQCWRSATCAYPNVSRGEDVAFLAQQYGDGERATPIDDPASYICVRHGGNVTDALDLSGWEPVPLEQYLSEEQQAFYAGLRAVTV